MDDAMRKGQTTLKDIAEVLQLSVSTVSRAINGYPEIKEDTRKAVLRKVAEMGYEPNQVAQNLRRSATQTLGIVIPDLGSHFFSACLSGFHQVAAAKGYNVMICQSNESYADEKNKIQMLINSRVDGLIISLSKETSNFDHLQKLQERNLPFVLFDRVSEEVNTTTITVDELGGAYNATEHLIRQGCRHIAHLSGPENLSICRQRLKGYLQALEQFGIPVQDELIRHSSLQEEDVMEQVRQLLHLPQPPDAIFALNDLAALQAMFVIRQMGLKVPQDIALVGFNNEPTSALVDPALTTVAQPAYEIGQLAARSVIEQISGAGSMFARKVLLETKLIVRESSLKRKA